MKKFILLLIISILFASLSAQEISLKYGDVTRDELSFSVYPQDSSANAVVLYEDISTNYKYTGEDFKLISVYKRKIKILKSEGVEVANVSIPYYLTTNLTDRGEKISSIEAFSYNLENGKVKKEKMGKDLVFDERVNERWKQIKFSIPSVKVGSVIEYKYVHESNLYHTIPDWVIQKSIPVMNSHYEVIIPKYFIFNIETLGFQKIDVKETTKTQNYSVNTLGMSSATVPTVCRVLNFTVKDVPAIKDEPYVWCTSDFVSRISFELQGTDFGQYKPIAKNWKEIEELLDKDSDFGDKLRMDNPYRDEVWDIIRMDIGEAQKIQKIFSFVKAKIKWNGKFAFYGNKVKDAIKDGVGSNADINFVLLCAFRDAGIKAFPVLLSRRDMGRLPYSFPSLSKLNTFIIGILTNQGNSVYLDGSTNGANLNILNPTLLVDRAREYGAPAGREWVDLTGIGTNKVDVLIEASVEGEGLVKGKCSAAYRGQMAYDYAKGYYDAKDTADYKEKKQADLGGDIVQLEIKGLDSLSTGVQESLTFSKKVLTNDDYIYLPSMLFPHITKNPFTQSERLLPIEFSYPYQCRIICYWDIPEGFQVEELPEPVRIVLADNSCRCTYSISQKGDRINIVYQFVLDRILFSQMEYPDLKKIWETLCAKNTEQIVLKKI